jgi:hypothetical protein
VIGRGVADALGLIGSTAASQPTAIPRDDSCSTEDAVTGSLGGFSDERQWLTGTDPLALLNELYPMRSLGSVQPQTRPSRMYLLACARAQWTRLPNVFRALVALAEVYADSPRDQEWLRVAIAPIAAQLMHSDGEESDLIKAETDLSLLSAHGGESPVDILARLERRGQYVAATGLSTPPLAPSEWQGLTRLSFLPFEVNTPSYGWVPRKLHSLRLLREVYGHPYRFVPFRAAWRTSDVMTIARNMYESRDFSAMPILADALQDAGCDDDDILRHCRDAKQTHVRGCWVVDLVLNFK